jgi:DNA repair photolyase
MASKDIGVNNTCMHGCPYCYSTASYDVAKRRFDEHDPDSPSLWGNLEKSAEITKEADAQMRLFR